MIQPVIDLAVKYLRDRNYNFPVDVLNMLIRNGYSLTDREKKERVKAIKSKAIHSRELKQADYSTIRDNLWVNIAEAIESYLSSSSAVTSFKNQMVLAVSQAYTETANIAYEEGGGSLPLDNDTASFANGELQAQLGFIDSLFETLKALRKEDEFDSALEAADTADRWTSALDGFYNSIKLAGAGNMMITWNLGNTEKHCDTCLSLDGQRHRASWFFSHGYTPRKPGSNTDCGGYNCDCSLTDDDGNEFTI